MQARVSRSLLVLLSTAVVAAACSSATPSLMPPSPGSHQPAGSLSPLPSLPPSPLALPTPMPTPTAAPGTTHIGTPLDASSLPVRASALSLQGGWSMVPGPDGGLVVAVWRCQGFEPEVCSTVMATYAPDGALRDGWPAKVEGACSLMLAGGSLRAVCDRLRPAGASVDPGGLLVLAFDENGHPLSDWPVEVSGYDYGARVVDGSLYLPTGQSTVTRISPDGTVRTGELVSFPSMDDDCAAPGYIGADGTMFLVMRCDHPADDAAILAADLDGPRPGWPVAVPGGTSDPVTGPGGRVYLVRQSSEEGAEGWLAAVTVLEPNGQLRSEWLVTLPEELPHVGSWYEPYMPMPPLVGEGGGLWLVTGTTATAVDSVGRVRSGWPYRSSVALSWGPYEPCCNDCIGSPVRPLLGPDNVLFLLQEPRSNTVGEQISAIGIDGKMRDGWPVVLRRPGAWFDSAVPGPDGTLYALAIEPESLDPDPEDCELPAHSATILAIDQDGEVRYRVTVVEP